LIQKKSTFPQAVNQSAHGLRKGLQVRDDQGIKKIETYGFYWGHGGSFYPNSE